MVVIASMVNEDVTAGRADVRSVVMDGETANGGWRGCQDAIWVCECAFRALRLSCSTLVAKSHRALSLNVLILPLLILTPLPTLNFVNRTCTRCARLLVDSVPPGRRDSHYSPTSLFPTCF